MPVLGQCRAERVRNHPSLGRALFASASLAFISLAPVSPASAKVRISGLSDVSFGTISNLTVDAVQAQSVCVYSNGSGQAYSVRADGSGSGGAFTLANGITTLAYSVRWNSQPGQSNGTALTAGALLGGQTTNAQNQTCSSGPPTTASLIVTLPATSLSSATAGTYGGTLTVIVSEE
jgi:hypothetical protein